MRNIKLTIGYDGSSFHGWQRQPGRISIQGVIEDALSMMTGETVTLIGSGRTDAGVHALGQVASFTTSARIPVEGFMKGLNSLLPETVTILRSEEVPPDFHALRDAVGKFYRYHIVFSPAGSPFWVKRAWLIKNALDLDLMAEAAGYLVGTHDFRAFQASGGCVRTTVRTVHVAAIGKASRQAFPPSGSEHYVFSVAAGGFLRYMVRNIVGTLVEVGRGKRDPGWMRDVLASRERAFAGITAPPFGLYLDRVFYDRDEFRHFIEASRSDAPCLGAPPFPTVSET